MNYSVEHISNIVDGSFISFHQNDAVEHLLTDSRRLIFPATTLFFALNGLRRNGNKFIDDLYKKGVRNFVVNDEKEIAWYEDANIILVKNSLHALQQLAAYHRSLFDIPVIGITGSNGKTIVKEWLNQLLDDTFSIVRSPRSYNSQIGVPLSVWQMNASHNLGIFEAGISEPGEMNELQKIIQPSIGVFTNIGEAHGENFKDIGHKAIEKVALFKNASAVIYPSDSINISNALEGLENNMELFGWGENENAKVLIKKIEKQTHDTIIHFSYTNANFSATIPFTDDASVENAVTCICVLLYLKIPAETIVKKLFLLSPIAMRLELKSAINTLPNDFIQQIKERVMEDIIESENVIKNIKKKTLKITKNFLINHEIKEKYIKNADKTNENSELIQLSLENLNKELDNIDKTIGKYNKFIIPEGKQVFDENSLKICRFEYKINKSCWIIKVKNQLPYEITNINIYNIEASLHICTFQLIQGNCSVKKSLVMDYFEIFGTHLIAVIDRNVISPIYKIVPYHIMIINSKSDKEKISIKAINKSIYSWNDIKIVSTNLNKEEPINHILHYNSSCEINSQRQHVDNSEMFLVHSGNIISNSIFITKN